LQRIAEASATRKRDFNNVGDSFEIDERSGAEIAFDLSSAAARDGFRCSSGAASEQSWCLDSK
jgi:hypothetical protein